MGWIGFARPQKLRSRHPTGWFGFTLLVLQITILCPDIWRLLARRPSLNKKPVQWYPLGVGALVNLHTSSRNRFWHFPNTMQPIHGLNLIRSYRVLVLPHARWNEQKRSLKNLKYRNNHCNSCKRPQEGNNSRFLRNYVCPKWVHQDCCCQSGSNPQHGWSRCSRDRWCYKWRLAQRCKMRYREASS